MEFQVDRMGCAGCARTITDAIHAVDPGAKIDIDLVTKRVAVTTDADQAVIRQVLSNAGFAGHSENQET